MNYQEEFFALQIGFALKVKELKNISLSEALLSYSCFYKLFKIEGWDFRIDDPVWQEYIDGAEGNDLVDYSYQFYLQRLTLHSEEGHHPKFGCFSYEFEEKDNAIQIHFTNQDIPEPGALSIERIEIRKKELSELFSEVKRKYPEVKEVWGFSWLYNLEAYSRLFPPEHIALMKEINDWFKSMAFWGQFLDKYGFVKEVNAEKFYKDCENAQSFDGLMKVIPLFVQELASPVENFYRFYQID